MVPLSEMSASVLFSVIFSMTGLVIIALFACRHGVFDNCCKDKHHEPPQPDRYGIGVAEHEGLGTREVTARRAESEEEGISGDSEEESGRSGGLSEDD